MKKLLFVLVALFTCSIIYASFPVAQPLSPTLESSISEIVQPVSSDSGWQGIVSLSSAVLGLLIFGIPLGICAVIFGAMGLRKKLKGLAIAGLCLGIIEILIVLSYLAG
jgi:hypothetical protein